MQRDCRPWLTYLPKFVYLLSTKTHKGSLVLYLDQLPSHNPTLPRRYLLRPRLSWSTTINQLHMPRLTRTADTNCRSLMNPSPTLLAVGPRSLLSLLRTCAYAHHLAAPCPLPCIAPKPSPVPNTTSRLHHTSAEHYPTTGRHSPPPLPLYQGKKARKQQHHTQPRHHGDRPRLNPSDPTQGPAHHLQHSSGTVVPHNQTNHQCA